MMTKQLSLAITAALVFWGVSHSGLLHAQQSAPSATDTDQAKRENVKQLETVTVTARKREETLQDVPIAVTAFTSKKLFDENVQNLGDLQGKVPSAQIYAARGSNTTLTAYIRGIGQADPTWGFDPNVGLYLDDVYMARPQGAMLDVFDVERIEVLRGPQGTLYGKNTIGGAIKYISRALPTKTEGLVTVTAGTHGEKDVKAAIGGASANHVWRGRVAVASLHNDGFGKNVYQDSRNGNKNTNAWRASIGFFPSGNFDAQLELDGMHDNSNPRGAKLLVGTPFYPQYLPLDSDYDTRSGAPQTNYSHLRGSALTMKWRVNNDWMLKSISAYRDSDSYGYIDFDTLPPKLTDVGGGYKDHQFSQEFQANYDGGGALRGVVGLYYFKGTAGGEIDNVFFGSPPYDQLPPYGVGPGGIYGNNSGFLKTDSKAVYGDFTWALSPAWSLDVGGRFTRETKTALIQNYSFTDATFQSPAIMLSDFSGSVSSSGFTPKVALSWNANDHVMLYGSYSEGLHSGGYNIRANCVVIPSSCAPIKDEKVRSFELGSKMTFFDDKLMINSALYRANYSNIQLSVFTAYTLPNGTSGFFGDFTNAGRGHIEGLEEEFAWKPSENWQLSGQVAYMHTKYTEYMDAGVNVADQKRFTNAPRLSGGLTLQHTRSLANGSNLSARINYTYQTKVYPETSLSPVIMQPGYGLLNAGVVWDTKPWTFSLQGTNLAGKSYRTTGYNGTVFGWITGFYGPPRMVYLTARYSF